MLLEAYGFRASSEGDPQPRAPWDDFWYGAAYGTTMAGVSVGPETAMRIATVFMCVSKISQAIGSLPLQVYRRKKSGGKDLATEHELYPLLHSQPNALNTSMEWRETYIANLLLRGTAYSQIVGGRRGRVDALLPLFTDMVTPELLPNGRIRYKVREPKTGGYRYLAQEEVLRVVGLSANGLTGLNPIEYNRETFGMTVAQLAYGARFYKNNATPGGVLELDSTIQFKTPESKKKFRNDWQDMQTGADLHKMAVLEPGMKFKEVGMKHTDAQYLELMKFSDRKIGGLFGVPAHKLGDLERAHFANMENQNLEWVIDTLRPWCVRSEQAFQRDLVTEPDIFVEFNLEGLLRGDSSARTAFYQGGIQNGWLTRNEVREKENLNPIDGLDEPLTPQNMARAGEQPANPAGGAGRDAGRGAGRGANQDREGDGAPRGALELVPRFKAAAAAAEPAAVPAAGQRGDAILRAAARAAVKREIARVEVVAKRKANDPAAFAKALTKEYTEHADYLAERLALGLPQATGFCTARSQMVLEQGIAMLLGPENETAAVELLIDMAKEAV